MYYSDEEPDEEEQKQEEEEEEEEPLARLCSSRNCGTLLMERIRYSRQDSKFLRQYH